MAQWTPPPNTPLLPDPTRDSIWRRWFEYFYRTVKALIAEIATQVVGPASSTDNAVARWDGATGKLLKNSGVIIDNSNNVTGVVNLNATGNLQVDGNTILGNAAGDTLTINAGTWTYGANWTATRTSALVAGEQVVLTQQVSVTGDAGGTSAFAGTFFNTVVGGANHVQTARGAVSTLDLGGSADITGAIGHLYRITITGTGDVDAAQSLRTSLQLNSAGNLADASGIFVGNPVLASTGTITKFRAITTPALGNALIAECIGISIANMTGSPIMTGIESELSAGSGKKNLNITGTADNSLAGPLYLAQDNKTQQTASAMLAGTGAPNNANGNNGDYYFRGDGGVATHIYFKSAGTWAGII